MAASPPTLPPPSPPPPPPLFRSSGDSLLLPGSDCRSFQEQQSKRLLRKELKKGALRKPSHESILRKLILASGKAFSEDSSLRIMNSVASMVSRMENSETSSGSMEEQRGRKQYFAHYDCHSICADYGPLLSQVIWKSSSGAGLPYGPGSGPIGPLGPFGSAPSRVCLPQRNTTNPCGGSLDVLSVSSPVESDDHGVTSSSGSSAMLDEGDGKYNGLILSCPFFRNEIGGEPTRHVSLGTERYLQRWIVQDVSSVPSGDPSASAASRSAKAKDSTETWHRIPSAAEACVLENLGNVYLGGRLCAYRQPQLVIEHVDHGAFYYRHCFLGKAHQNYFGIDENLGPVAVSIARDKLDAYQAKQAGLVSPYLYRMIVRLSDLSTFRGSILEESLPSYQMAREQMQAAGQPLSPTGAVATTGQTSSLKIPVKELLELVVSDLLSGCLRLAVPLPRTEEMLLKRADVLSHRNKKLLQIYTRYKVGVLLCKAGQCSEEQMYNNEHSSAPFEEFLDILGQRIRLKGFDKYRGGLDNKGDSTGTHSVYTSYQQYEIMFHVSTMLPFTPSNRQQLARKRHIGNDIVTIIFQEPGALPFCPQTMRSHFQHVFIVVQAVNPNTDKVKYSVSVSRYKDVPAFGPPIPENYGFPRSQEFREFLLTKGIAKKAVVISCFTNSHCLINAENAVHVSAKFAAMAARTRREFMRELAENHCISHSIESSSAKITCKIANMLPCAKILGNKRKDRPRAKVFLEAFNRGAIVWDVQVLTELENFSLCCTVDCFLAVSADYLVMIERSTETTLFCTATHSVIGWTLQGNSLKLYYDHADVIILRTVDDDDGLIIADIITRLKFVTKGCELIKRATIQTQEMMLRQSGCESLDFRIQYEGIVSDVDMYGHSWQAGLRQGSRIVEICKVSVASLTYPKMIEFLKSPNSRVLVIAPLEDGSPRRGCEDPHCPAVRGEVTPIVPSDWVSQPGSLPLHLPGRSPPSYDSLVTRPRIGTDLEGVPSSCKGALKVHGSGNDLCPSNCSSKSLDELRSRRAHCYSDTAAGLDSGFDSTRNSADYQSTTASSLSSEDRWYQSLMLQSTARAKNLSSSSSGGSSDLSSEAAVHQGKVDTTLLHPQVGVGNLVIGSRNLPLNISAIGSDKGAPAMVSSGGVGSTAKLNAFRAPPMPTKNYKHRSSDTSMVTLKEPVSSQQDMLNISDSDASKETISLADTNSARPLSPCSGAKYWSSRFADVPSTSTDLTKCSSLVDLATRAIEGVTQMAVSQQGSPELTSYNLVLQASRRKIVLLEERVKHLLTELSGERESKRHLEAEVSRLNDENKALSNELKAAKEELQHFTQWFHSTVENPMAYLQEPVLNDHQ
ncbi:signal induced proliferation associated 1 [Trichuris trichiura]|uniref:Signal induced proliferation associated 1 n=1 Tax=Trichuris trichiura TaxID=36087 RepID=A0A077Z0R3_TRITR|nr:signal induced proliferation associated 1 [Trichuris trichiura]